jgi:uncharacterized protein involved in exopolysaccharide biosynthesis
LEAPIFEFHRSWLGIKQACVGHKLLIVATSLFTVVIVAAYIILWPPTYSAQVQLVAESDKDMAREGFYQTWAVFRKDALSDEVQLFTSAPVLGQVVRRLGLTYDDVYHPFLSHAVYLWTQSPPGRLYRKVKDWIWPKKHGPYDPTPEQVDRARTLADFKSGVQLEAISGTNVGNLVVRGPSPRVAEMANSIVRVYFDQRRRRHVQEANDAYQALDDELRKASDELRRLEERMAAYYADNQLLLTFEKDKLDVTQWTALKASIVDLKSAIASQENSLREIEAQIAHEEKLVVSARVTAPNPIAQSLTDKLTQLRVSLRQTLMHFRPDAPEVRDLQRQIEILGDQIARLPATTVQQRTTVVNDTYENLRRRKAALDAELAGEKAALRVKQDAADAAQATLTGIPEKMKVTHQLDREHQALEKKYSVLQEKLMIAAVSRATAASAPTSIRVVEPAEPPNDAAWPRTKLLFGLAIVVGSVAGVVLALLIDLVHGRVTRYALVGPGRALPIYAIVGRDRGLAAELFRSRLSGTLPRGGAPVPIARRAEVAD